MRTGATWRGVSGTFLPLVLILAACGDEDDPSVIIDFGASTGADPIPLATCAGDASVRLDWTDAETVVETRVGDEEILSLDHVAVLDSEVVVVGDPQTRYLWLISPDGVGRRLVGGDGDGPSEFRSIDWVGIDSEGGILAWDRRRSRMTQWDTVGALLREGRVWARISQFGGNPIGVMRDGAVLFTASEMGFGMRGREANEVYRTWSLLHRWDWDGLESDEVGRIPGRIREIVPIDAGSRSGQSLIFGDEGAIPVGARSGLFVVSSATGQIDWVDMVDSVRVTAELVPGRDRPITSQDIEVERARRISEAQSRPTPPGLNPDAPVIAAEEVSVADRFPVVSAAVKGRTAGSVLIATFAPPSIANRTWYEVDLERGGVSMCLEIPRDLHVIEVTARYIYLIEQDELGLQKLLRVPLEPETPSDE